jgi:hypothetical protein
MKSLLRWASLAVLAAYSPAPAALGEPGADAPPQLLGDAFDKLLANQGRWSYTESEILSGIPGNATGETIFLVDPSKPYAEQYKPVQVEGRPPGDGDRSRFRGLGERVAERRRREQEESSAHPGDRLRIRVNFHVVTPDLAHAAVLAEDAEGVTYRVPLRTSAGGGSSFDTFQLEVRVGKARREFEHATIRQRQPMRIAFVVSVADAAIDLDFSPVDPRFPAVVTHIAQSAKVHFVFFRRVVTFEMRRSGFRRVTPYDERFGVKIGPLRTIDF